MSIWCSWEPIGFDDLYGDEPLRGQVRSYASGFSNHYPTRDGQVEQPAKVELASIPSWCVPGHADAEIDGVLGEWLRLSVTSVRHDFASGGKPTGEPEYAGVVMDEDAVRALVEDLQSWLAARKLHEGVQVYDDGRPAGGVSPGDLWRLDKEVV